MVLSPIIRDYGYVGLYILQSLEFRVAKNASLRFEMSANKLNTFINEIGLYKRGLKLSSAFKGNEDNVERCVRTVISQARDLGYLVITQSKNKVYISFPHIKCRYENKVILSVKKNADKVTRVFKPNDISEVEVYFAEINKSGYNVESVSRDFYDYWEERGWKRKSGLIRDWKATARRWVRSDYLSQNNGFNERIKRNTI